MQQMWLIYLPDIILISIMIWLSIEDLKYRSVPLLGLAAAILTGMTASVSAVSSINSNVSSYTFGNSTWSGMLSGALPGLLLAVFAMVLRCGMGTGDGIFLTAVGIRFGAVDAVNVFLTGMCIMFGASMLFLAKEMIGGKLTVSGLGSLAKKQIPFIPFMSIAYIMRYIVMMSS